MSGVERPGYLKAKVSHEVFNGYKPKVIHLRDTRPRLLAFFAGRNIAFREFIQNLKENTNT
jgi:hypothetical protein